MEEKVAIGKITKMPLREIWKNEAEDFTAWLQDNIDVVGDVIGVELVNAEREQPAGNFKVDLIANDESGDRVIIENQLEKSDHKHLGQLISYLVSFEAKKAIWITPDPRPEHISAISWLNESTNVDFYLLKIEAIQIEESLPAPLLTLIVGSSQEIKAVGALKKADSAKKDLRRKFWGMLLKKAKEKGHSLFDGISPTENRYITKTSGKSGIQYSYWVNDKQTYLEILIDDKKSNEKNLRIFNELKSHKDEIDRAFGEDLEWNEHEGHRKCAIKFYYDRGICNSKEEEWDEIHNEAIEGMMKLEKAIQPFINKLEV